MSIIDLAPRSPTEPLEPRTPPADLAAEQAVLGAMLLSKDAIADVVETLKIDDFYRPAHGTVYAAVLDLYGRGEPADAVMVAGELTKSGEIARIGLALLVGESTNGAIVAADGGANLNLLREIRSGRPLRFDKGEVDE